jgi:hypothetical protein
MIKTIIAFIQARRKSFLIADAVCSAAALVYFVQPGNAFIGPVIGIGGLVGAILVSAALLASIFIKAE